MLFTKHPDNNESRRNLTVSKPSVQTNRNKHCQFKTHMNQAINLELALSNKHLQHLGELLDDIICYEDWSYENEDEKEENEHQKYALEEVCIAIRKHLMAKAVTSA